MEDINAGGFGFFLVLVAAITGIAVLINRGNAKPGVVVILLTFPFLYILSLPIVHGEIPSGADNFSSALIIGIIASIIGGIILRSLKK